MNRQIAAMIKTLSDADLEYEYLQSRPGAFRAALWVEKQERYERQARAAQQQEAA